MESHLRNKARDLTARDFNWASQGNDTLNKMSAINGYFNLE